ncbi:hypothetical protein G6L37_04085 [Agrobacterium rubi]|nr:hypothetical protein [Agrobacterium rubi]NTF24530.1 hypothetical protein [Agrobacterium rubi]
MTKAKDKNVGAKGIGLVTEHRLPEAFKARTDDSAGTVEIKRENGRSLDVAINSFASVANILSIFSPDGEPSLKPEHTIRIVDDFTGREITVTANTLVDVAAAFRVFLVEKGKYLPTASPAPAPSVEAPAAVQALEPAQPAADEEPTPADVPAVVDEPAKPAAAKPKSKAKGATVAKSAPAKGKKAASVKKTEAKEVKVEPPAENAAVEPKKPEPKKKPAKPAAAAAPVSSEWIKDLPQEHVDDSGLFRLEARTLALPKERAKTVDGIADGSTQFPQFGYEVLMGDKPGGDHAGWIIVEDPKSWIVTGFGDVTPSKHANLSAASIRIRITNLPRITQA